MSGCISGGGGLRSRRRYGTGRTCLPSASLTEADRQMLREIEAERED